MDWFFSLYQINFNFFLPFFSVWLLSIFIWIFLEICIIFSYYFNNKQKVVSFNKSVAFLFFFTKLKNKTNYKKIFMFFL